MTGEGRGLTYRVQTAVLSLQQFLAVLEHVSQHLARLVEKKPFRRKELQKLDVGSLLRLLQYVTAPSIDTLTRRN